MPVPPKKRRTTRNVAKKFLRFMQDSDQLVQTRTELRNLYKNNFLPVLTDPWEKRVQFSYVFWMFRTDLKVVENRPVHDREVIVYLAEREEERQPQERQPQERQRQNEDGFTELKKKLVDRR